MICAEFEAIVKEAYQQKQSIELSQEIKQKKAKLVEAWKSIVKKSALLYRFEEKYYNKQ